MGCCTVKFVAIGSRSQSIPIEAGLFIVKRYTDINERYAFQQELGSGNFGRVTLCRHRETGALRAVKSIKKSPKDFGEIGRFCEEMEILKGLDHPNIIKLYEYYEDSTDINLVTEYVEGGPLYELIIRAKQLSEEVAAGIIRQLLSAVAYCHSRRIVHRDLKLENILLDNPNIKVIDFGLSTLLTPNHRLSSSAGSVYYTAPEVLDGNYDEKCDVWSCGVLLCVLLTGKQPFKGRSKAGIMARVKEGLSFTDLSFSGVSSGAVALLKKMLSIDPTVRISAESALRDPWVEHSRRPINLDGQILQSLRSFKAAGSLQRSVLMVLATQLCKSEEARMLARQFSTIDANSDGRLSKEEIYSAFATYGTDLTLNDVSSILDEIDINSSGYIEFTEFLMACMHKHTFANELNLRYAFKIFDVDNSLNITASEIRTVLGQEVISSDKLWEDIISIVDDNSDGQIDFEEFKGMVMRVLINLR
jgi:calcium-dependent protein kinase